MSIMIIGANGNMGRRYQSILKYLGKDFTCVDVGTDVSDLFVKYKEAEGVIIATPTNTHTRFIRDLAREGLPILCEKPIAKDLNDLRQTLDLVKSRKTKLSMVWQYAMLSDSGATGDSVYDFYNHGNDGLVWDCIQIIGLAKGPVTLDEESPLWKCRINGKKLHIAHMNRAYVDFIKLWLGGSHTVDNAIWDAHQKTYELNESVKHGPVY